MDVVFRVLWIELYVPPVVSTVPEFVIVSLPATTASINSSLAPACKVSGAFTFNVPPLILRVAPFPMMLVPGPDSVNDVPDSMSTTQPLQARLSTLMVMLVLLLLLSSVMVVGEAFVSEALSPDAQPGISA